MKRAPLFLTLFIVLGVAGFFFYKGYFNKRIITIWEIIAEQTVLVYEAGECTECLSQIQKTPFWSAIQKSIADVADNGTSKGLLDAIVKAGDKLFVSLHVIKKDDFDLVYYLPLNKAKEVDAMLSSLPEKGYKISQRELSGVQINEVKLGEQMFSWTSFEDVWVASFTPFLIEDVIRTYKSDQKKNFNATLSGVQQFPKVKNDAGNIYVNLKGVSQWLATFLQEGEIHGSGQASLLDVKLNSGNIILNGFSSAGEGKTDELLSYFYDQSPAPFTLKQYVPVRALAVTSFGVTDGKKLFTKLPISKNNVFLDSIRVLGEIDPEELYSGIDKELAVCYFEDRGDKLSNVFLLNTKNTPQWLTTFERLAQATEKEDTLYVERYSGYEIREIDLVNLPEKLFKPLVHGFERTYYTSLANTIIIADKVESLRKFLDDIDREDTWGKSVMFNQYLESTLLESNLSIYINSSRAYGHLQKKLNAKWSNRLTKPLRGELTTLSFAAVQFSTLNNNFYTNVSFILNEDKAITPEQTQRIRANLDHRIISGPFVVKNHVTKRNEIVVQDSTYALHYFALDGKRLWKRNLQGKIIHNVYQVDYLSNNKLQLFLLANGKLEIIDRLGNPVSPFPVTAPNQPVDFVQVVDYDNSKRYRYLLTEKSGKLWMLDKEGKSLDGWKPRVVDGPLLVPARHHRIRGKDFILAIRKDGIVHLFSRRGEDIKGFPLNLENKPGGSYFLEEGNAIASTNFVMVTKDGDKIKLNVEGRIVSREPLVRTAIDDVFALVPEHSGKSYTIARQNSKQFELLNEQGNRILINDFSGKSNIHAQYYDFGSGRVYYVLVDESQELAYIYDAAGQLLTPVPIEAEHIELFIDGNNIYYTVSFEHQLAIHPLVNF
ncbi:MAG: hypothetical protein KF845_16175 [Cyclobacteriaceae bacterium]|nr:hypothetical protein [Cyclobacteriaceae bacterium]